ncbi:MAG: hypothetical protein ACQ9ET_06085, partial [Nitrosomonadaceae bacterium]
MGSRGPKHVISEEQFIELVTSSYNFSHAHKKAMAQYGMSKHSYKHILKRAKKLGVKPGIQHDRDIPDGFEIKGSSTMVRTPEGLIQWIKTNKKQEEEIRLIREFAAGLAKSLKNKSTLIPPPVVPGSDRLLTVYVEPEPHFGMLSWATETDENYDSKIAKHVLQGAAKRLVDA